MFIVPDVFWCIIIIIILGQFWSQYGALILNTFTLFSHLIGGFSRVEVLFC